MNLKKIEAALQSYVTLALPSVMTAYLAGYKDPKTLLIVAGAAIVLPLARAMKPSDKAYGIVSIAAEELTKETAAISTPTKG